MKREWEHAVKKVAARRERCNAIVYNHSAWQQGQMVASHD